MTTRNSKPPPRDALPVLRPIKISIGSATSAKITGTTTPADLIRDIQAGRWAKEVAAVRAATGEAASGLKKKLPAALWSGTFSKRANAGLIQVSGLICADIDDVAARVGELHEIARNDPHAVAAFISPSGTGFKVIFKADNFASVRAHVLNRYRATVDESGKDVARLCFVSHDAAAFYNGNALPLKAVATGSASASRDNFRGKTFVGDVSRDEIPDGRIPCICSAAGGVGAAGASSRVIELSKDVKAQIEKAVEIGARATRQNNAASFKAALALIQLRGVDDLAGMSQPERNFFAETWFLHLKLNGRVTSGKPRSHYYSDVFASIKNAKQLHDMNTNNPVRLAWAKAQVEPIPPDALAFDDDPTMQRLISLAYQLHLLSNGGEWFLSRNTAGKLMGLSDSETRGLSENFAVLIAMGIIEVVTPHKPGSRAATSYKWTGSNQL